jgi:hypothetical protein
MNGFLLATMVAVALEPGPPVSVSYCVSGPPRATASREIVGFRSRPTFSAPGGTLRRTSELHSLAEESASRVLESLDLTKVGLGGTLHLTLAYIQGAVRVEGALLTPEAITIK